MVEIIKGWVDWQKGYHNDSRLHVVVDEASLSNHDNLVYEQRGTIYFAEDNGYVSFFHYSSPGRGYGGRKFTIKMKDGTTKDLIGPWSSRSGVTNAVGFTPCTEVSLHTKNDKMIYGGHLTIDCILKNIDKITFEDFDFGSKIPPVSFPEGSKLLMSVYHMKSFSTVKRLLFSEASSDQIEANDGDILYLPTILFPDGTLWEKNEYLNKEWDKLYGRPKV